MHMHPPLEMSVSRQLIALVVAIKNKKTKHHIRQKQATKTCPRQQNKLSPCFVWYAFYGLHSGNGVGPILTTLKPTVTVSLLHDYRTMHNIMLSLSVLSDVYVHQCTILADIHIRLGTAGSNEIIIQGKIVSAAENDKNRWFGTMYWGDARVDYELECYLDTTGVKGLKADLLCSVILNTKYLNFLASHRPISSVMTLLKMCRSYLQKNSQNTGKFWQKTMFRKAKLSVLIPIISLHVIQGGEKKGLFFESL